MGKHDIIDAEIIEVVVAPKQEPAIVLALKYLVSVAVYCIIGLAIDYGFFVAAGATTAWANPLTYAVMIFWPFILIWQFMIIVFWIAVVCLVIWMIYMMFTKVM